MKTRKFYWKKADGGNARSFLSFLVQLHQAYPTKRLLIILDNGPIHRSKKVQRFVQKNDWVKLYFLPTYSPEYNPIERFWKWLKKCVYGAKAYSSVDALIKNVRKMIWHYNENWLLSSIKFEMRAYKVLL